jgi:hypothetical protein
MSRALRHFVVPAAMTAKAGINVVRVVKISQTAAIIAPLATSNVAVGISNRLRKWKSRLRKSKSRSNHRWK